MLEKLDSIIKEILETEVNDDNIEVLFDVRHKAITIHNMLTEKTMWYDIESTAYGWEEDEEE